MLEDLRFLTALKPVTHQTLLLLSMRMLEHTYGFINPSVEASGRGANTVRGLRMALRDRWVLETVNVTITPANTSLTRVALSFDIR